MKRNALLLLALAVVAKAGSESGAVSDGGGSSDSACADSETWHMKGDDEKNCAWVGEKKANRCKAWVKSEDGVKAKVACPVACGTCPASPENVAFEDENERRPELTTRRRRLTQPEDAPDDGLFGKTHLPIEARKYLRDNSTNHMPATCRDEISAVIKQDSKYASLDSLDQDDFRLTTSPHTFALTQTGRPSNCGDLTHHWHQMTNELDRNNFDWDFHQASFFFIINRTRVQLPAPRNAFVNWWKTVLQRVLANRSESSMLSLKFAVSAGDKSKSLQSNIFHSSAPKGYGCIPNFLDIKALASHHQYKAVRWEDRFTRPVWRGTPWGAKADPSKPDVRSQVLKQCERLRLVDWSIDHPDLLDAKIAHIRLGKNPQKQYSFFWKENATNGMSRYLPPNRIPERDYYARYQVAVVMGGIGAAFRLTHHLSTETAVVLQDYAYELWYTKYLIPFVHYIPLKQDLSDLNGTLVWIRQHPTAVRRIANNGKRYYNESLRPACLENHIWELLHLVHRRQHCVQVP